MATASDGPDRPACPVETIGVIGAGTMGAGIAQLAAGAGARTLLYDPVPEALERGAEEIRTRLERGAQRGRWSAPEAQAAIARLEPVATLEELAPAGLAIEAAPESLSVKHELLERLCAVVADDCVLATNTSSLLVTAVAAGATHPERVVGMHFFNPAPIMRLVEVVAGEASGEAAVQTARAVGEAMGKRVIVAADGPGFLVNRCGRPFGLEALRLLEEGIAPLELIDRICRVQGGFRMGPFELMDLVGVDTGLDVSRSFFEQSFGEPRWQPSPITVRTVAAGRNGRKSGRGYYDYRDGAHRPADPEAPAGGGGSGAVVVAGAGVLAEELRSAAALAGYTALDPATAAASGEEPFLILDCGADEDDAPLQGGPQALLCAGGSLAALDPEGGAAGFHVLPPLDAAGLVELTRRPTTSVVALERTATFFTALGKHAVEVGDAPGLVLGRIVAQLVNEAAFALRAGVGSAEDVDAGMLLGLNYPHGPLHWADAIGLDHVLLILDGLWEEYREPRYRAAPLLRQHVLDGRLGHHTGAGFFDG